MKILKILIWTLALGIAGFILFITILVFSPYIRDFVNREPFDSKRWITWVESESESDFKLRWNMVHDLTKKYELVGMTVEEIKALLGEPATESKFYISYFLGYTGHGINTGSLSMTIKDGIVSEYKISDG